MVDEVTKAVSIKSLTKDSILHICRFLLMRNTVSNTNSTDHTQGKQLLIGRNNELLLELQFVSEAFRFPK